MSEDIERVKAALLAIDPVHMYLHSEEITRSHPNPQTGEIREKNGYETWRDIGYALKSAGLPYELFDEFSSRDESNYNPEKNKELWDRSFKEEGRSPDRSVTISTLFWWAKQYGFTDLKPADPFAGVLTEDQKRDDLIKYLKTLFMPGEYVALSLSSKWNERKGDYDPWYREKKPVLLDDLITDIEFSESVDDLLKYNHKAGAWVCLNPVDGKGGTDDNVTCFRHILIESDKDKPEKFINAVKALRLPVSTLTYSAGKSVHATVKIKASTRAEAESCFNLISKILREDYGITVDPANKNPSRLTRLPSVQRGEKWQKLLETNIGFPTWDEWKEWYESEKDIDLPAVIHFTRYQTEPLPELPEPIIDGVLRKGHKMIITGASKMGKSWLMINLMISIAEGLPWLGFPTKQGKVLYINLEIDQASFENRVSNTYDRMFIPDGERHYENVDLLCLRGQAKPMDELLPSLNRIIRNGKYALVIVDPIYKVITGDENNASDMAYFCNQFDKICELGCSVAYVHHHSKGASNYKDAMNRGSGSGVFARDADALIDFSALSLMKEGEIISNEYDIFAKAYRAEFTLREFKTPEPINVWFENCNFRIDEGLAGCALVGSQQGNRDKSPNNEKHAKRKETLDMAYDSAEKQNGLARLEDIAKIAKVTEKTIRTWANDRPQEYFINNGLVGKSTTTQGELGKENGKTPFTP